jgi:hypothetical protein
MSGAPNAAIKTRRTKADSTFRTRRTLERLYIFIAATALLVLVGLTLLATGVTQYSGLLMASPGQGAFSTETRTGRFVINPRTDRFQQLIFSNDTGQIVEPSRPCDNASTATPIGRFDAIKRSFSAR